MKTILTVLNITQEQYSTLLFNQGINYLERKFDGYPDIMQIFSYSKLFWHWYERQYKLVDQLFIIRDNGTLEDYNYAHQNMNNYPSPAISKLIQDDYDKMFQQVKQEQL